MTQPTSERIESLLTRYDFNGAVCHIDAFGNGHINDTFRIVVAMPDGTTSLWILQRINTAVFQDVAALMNNISSVTAFMQKKIAARGGDPLRETLTLLPSTDGHIFITDECGDSWRVYRFIENATSFQSADSNIFYESARAFGNFLQLLSDYPAQTLTEIIPHFHDTPARFRAFIRAVKEDKLGRAASVRREIEFLLDRENEAAALTALLDEGKLPLRVTHNDTKLNNVLIDDRTGRGLCVIDLDTVMPGSALYDYGDSIRFGASTAAEDEPDLSRVEMSMDLFEAYTDGYLETAGSAMPPLEKELMPMGAKLMTLECGMRFLTDYLEGDHYFKIHREGQNLDRARTQQKLVADMESKWSDMQHIVARFS